MDPAALGARPSVSELAAVAMGDARKRFMENVIGALGSDRPEFVHQARVALRKLRLYLRLFRSRIGRERAQRLGRDLRWAFVSFGRLRDVQVFRGEVLPQARAPRASVRAFSARVERREAAAREQLLALAAGARFRAMCSELAQLELELRERGDPKRARGWLMHRLRRMRHHALARAHKVRDSRADLHALRKQLKKLRYAAQLADRLGQRHPKRAREFRARMSGLQNLLGALNDLRVARQLIVSARAAKVLRSQLTIQLSAAEDAREAELERALTAFVQAPTPWQ